ncbi:hypothetical protein V2H45_21340 [Tumidithrix elongata RA019]|uniref:Uncharacterized protein n=1 Tax=Tumidithrix elongata BACA0141 TaxID=2716417 RepID=A0AAW9PXP4_9CYAN|nr:hypothetical protein [Tumidithrix elongata RA019]
MAIKSQEKIINLWIVFLLGLLFHTDLGLMPLFHELSVAHSHSQALAEVDPIMWLMLGFFVLPMAAIIGTSLMESRRYRWVHFGLTVVYSLLNFSHLVADLMVQPIVWYQIVLMAILFAIGLLLNLVSFQWIKEWGHTHHHLGDKIRA